MSSISIIITICHDRRIIRCINSLAKSVIIDDIELIVVDCDAAAEYETEIRNKWASARKLKYIKGKDKSIFDAINLGLSEVDSEWVWWLGADDILNKEFCLRSVIESKADVYFASTLIVTKGSQKVKRLYKPVRSIKLMLLGAQPPHFSTFIRSYLAKEYSFDIGHVSCADFFYFRRLLSRTQSIKYQWDDNVSTIMESCGNSDGNILSKAKSYLSILNTLAQEVGILHSFTIIMIRLLYKLQQFVFVRYRI